MNNKCESQMLGPSVVIDGSATHKPQRPLLVTVCVCRLCLQQTERSVPVVSQFLLGVLRRSQYCSQSRWEANHPTRPPAVSRVCSVSPPSWTRPEKRPEGDAVIRGKLVPLCSRRNRVVLKPKHKKDSWKSSPDFNSRRTTEINNSINIFIICLHCQTG